MNKYEPLIGLARNAARRRMEMQCDPQWVLALAAERDQLRAELEACMLLSSIEFDDCSEDTIKSRNAEIAKLRAEVEALRKDAERAGYWKQRAKSEEGHLFASDLASAAMALHKKTSHAETPWDELGFAQQIKIVSAAAAVIDAVNARRDERLPIDAAMAAKDGTR